MNKFSLVILLLCVELFATNITLTGTVVSYNQKMIGPRYMGYVKRIYYDIGDKVRRDDTLFEIESAEFDILKEQANLFLEQAEVMVNAYRTRLDTIKREKRLLRRKGIARKSDLEDLDMAAENVEASLNSAQSLVKNASQKVKQISTITGYLDIKAPNDGIIVEKRIRVGDMVAPGMLGMILVDLDHLQIEAEVGESDIKYLQKYKDVDIEIPSIDYKTRGYIKAIVPSANPMTHTFKIVVNFKKDTNKLFPGMYAKINININLDKDSY